MNGDFVKEFKLALHEPQVLEVDGKPRLIAPMGWQDLTPNPPEIAPLVVGTLTGLVDDGRAATADTAASKLIVHVKDPGRVEVRGPVEGEETRSVRETTDDGVAQSVNVQQGVTLVGKKRVPNPVQLRPYRTFREVEQPKSFFILRLQADPNGEQPKLALFEADGVAVETHQANHPWARHLCKARSIRARSCRAAASTSWSPRRSARTTRSRGVAARRPIRGEDQVRQIGNAVAVRTARALCAARLDTAYRALSRGIRRS